MTTRSSPAPSSARIPTRSKPTRAEKTARTRRALFRAAEKVVGEYGYRDATIAMIAFKAGVAVGTFYNYFESRQDLFDQLLPVMGREMLEFIRQRAESTANAIEKDEGRLRAFFEFLSFRPEFYRILYEAEVFAPAAFDEHMETVRKGYERVLIRARGNGDLAAYTDEEIEAVSMMLLGVRHYLCLHSVRRSGQIAAPPESAINAYVRMIGEGLFGPSARRPEGG